jgi:hypothetical protein
MNVYGASTLKKNAMRNLLAQHNCAPTSKKNRKKKKKRTADHDYTYIIYVFSLV